MKQALLYLFIFFSSSLLLAEDEANNLTIDTGFRYSQGLSLPEKEYTKWGHDFNGSLSLDGHLGENFFGRIAVTHQNNQFTCEGTYLKEAYAGLGISGIFSVKAGCLQQETFGWDQKNYDLTSISQSKLRTALYGDIKYKKMIEFNLDLFGHLTVQAMEDQHPENKEGQVALNFAWQKDIHFFTPLLQFSTFSNFESYAYTLGFKFEFEDFFLRLDAGQKREKGKKAETSFNLAPSYHWDSFFGAEKRDGIEVNMLGHIDQQENFNSEYHVAYNMNLNDHIELFSDVGMILENKKYNLGFNLGFTAKL